MSTANRLKHRKKANEHVSPVPQQGQTPQNTISSPLKSSPFNQANEVKHTEQQQKQYEPYYEISKCNPNGIYYTNTVFSHTAALQSNFSIPLGFIFSPILTLDNESTQLMQKSGDKIPRCMVCRAYMNCYNRFEKKKWICFLCNRQNDLDPNYNPKQQQNLQLQSSLYQCLSPQNFYTKEPPEQTYIFLIDICPDSASTKMIYYATAVMKEVLARTDLDEVCIHFFTYDQFVQEYDFSGEDIKCVINDTSLQNNEGFFQTSYLKDIREKLFQLLDSLEEISLNNTRKGSNFSKCFDYVFTSLRSTGGKFFILQSNEAIIGEPIFKQQVIKNPQNPNQIPPRKGPSLFETINKSFMQKYAHKILQNECSISFLTFCRNYKNLRSIHDTLKLCNSQLKAYSKDTASDLDKFYYQFSYLLNTPYFKNVRAEFLINSGWQYLAIYGNFYRTKQYVTFQIANLEPSRKFAVMVAPSNNAQFSQYVPPFCCMQVVTNYQFRRQCYLCVATIVQPVTGFVDRLYTGIDSLTTVACLAKGFLSSLRMDDLNVCRKRITDVASQIYLSALKTFKKPQNFPDPIITIIHSILGMLKSTHSQPDQINNTILMDKIISERNMIQFSGIQTAYVFSPYLFNLTELQPQMCADDGDFVYPPTVEIKFSNVKQGIFLMDVGLALYLFVKQCQPELSAQLFGKPKISKNDELNEELLNSQTTFKARQVQNLIRFLREQKSYGWIPLYIIKCGENSLNQRNFYLNFYGEKYEQFRSYRMNLEQFTAIISKPNSF